MDNQFKLLYKQIKEQKISRQNAIEQIKKLKVQRKLQTAPSKSSFSIEEKKIVIAITPDLLQEKAINYFKKLLSSEIKLPAQQIEADAPMDNYGIDSVMVMQMTNQLEKTFGSLPKTLFFEYQNIQSLTGYFLEAYREQLIGLLGIEEIVATTESTKEYDAITGAVKQPVSSKRRRSRFASLHNEIPQEKLGALDIAIIGVAGRYPQAKNIREFWNNLRNGKDSITEIPKERWDHSLYFDEDKNKPGKTYGKWGGFLDNVDQFDPLFFNISPRDAEMMDPQERLFLQCVYETLEDAGYTREALSMQQGFGLEGNVGVFVGVMYEEYQLYGAQEQIQGRPITLSGNPSSIANRVSYFCNFHGPSMAVDTMCSSSLTAIHLACQSLQRGGCELAVAGGVNVSIHPNKYLMLGQGKFVSSKGRCESFGQGGDGYVPGEGVGAVLLKPLSKAIADGDQIYGIIKGTAINHGGKTNGYTVPNPNAQASVIGQAIKESGVNPRAISYIEAHGTGTSLGDPIEIAGLKKTFQEYTKDKQFCAIGSAKSNIGHCESAAGIAGVTKILLQLKHRQLVPSLHSETLNPNIDFDNTPFVVQQELVEWKRPVIEMNGESREYPRIAGISSFGAGGANAHVVIEEYISKNQQRPSITITTQKPAVIVLSAKNEEQLCEQAQQLLAAIEEQAFSEISLADMAYTLQVGREAMEQRVGLIVGSSKELEEKLKSFVAGQNSIEDLYRGQVKRNKETLAVFTADEDMAKMIETWMDKGKYPKILDLWVKGLIIDWSKFYGDIKPRRISLPTYPFAKERYWVPEIETRVSSKIANQEIVNLIHPLLHQNTSDLSEQRFSSIFTGQEFFLEDHIVKGQRVLPGVAYLEMARAAVEQATGRLAGDKTGIQLENVVWIRPITMGGQPVQVHIGLYPEDNGEIFYEIYSETEMADVEPIVYSQGKAMLSPVAEAPSLDIKALQAQCSQQIFTSSQCYEVFKAMGIEYGPAHQGIEKVYVGSDQILAKLSLPSTVLQTQDQFALHPSLMDAALQASIGFIMESETLLIKPFLPFALQKLEIYKKCTLSMWVSVRSSYGNIAGDKVQKLDIDLCDDQGNVCIRMKEFTARMLEGEVTPIELAATIEALMLEPSWKEKAIGSEVTVPVVYEHHLVMLCELDEVSPQSIETGMDGVRCLTLQCEHESIEERFQAYVVQAFEEIKSILKDKPKGKVLIQIGVPIQGEEEIFAGISGLLKTAQLENPKLLGQLIEVDQLADSARIIEILKENSLSPMDNHVRYQEDKRFVAGWSRVETSQEGIKIPWKDQGVYLITGGAGGLGLIFAKEIAHKAKGVTLVFTGRTPLDDGKQGKIKELEALGALITYKQVDVTDKQAVIDLIQSIQDEFGSLGGIIHSAGIIRDNFIIKKNKEELQEVLAPKVNGLVNLDEASKELSLEFFILFSSIAGTFGNAAQADYSTANAFMDGYAKYRNKLVGSKQRQGQTLSINWPLWKDGGMHITEEAEKMMMQNSGLNAMRTTTGIEALYQGIASGKAQVVVMEGDIKRLQTALLGQSFPTEVTRTSSTIEEKKAVITIEQDFLQEKAIHYFKKLLSAAIKLPTHRIEADALLEQYGIDSVMVMQMTNQLEKNFGSLSKTLFFEYQNIQELTGYFLASYRDQLTELLGIQETAAATMENSGENMADTEPVKADFSSRRRPRFAPLHMEIPKEKTRGALDIAIIGVAGRYPQAKNIQEFWQNLRDGRDSITEIPKDRWDHSLYFDEDKNKAGKTYSKWGGFLDDVDQFDPLFFNISPREAEIMDPQERLFLECVYETLEDAGYSREALGLVQGFGLEGNVGVFAGAMYEEYQLYGAQEQIQGRSIVLSGNSSSIANRVSYFCNFHGPSMTVNTMCSSSLTAIHLACQSLQQGGCKLAIAGGVNISIHPNKYLMLGQGKFVSSKGRCESFGQGADGYVPGEGVGTVLLKPLLQAIAEGDHIYGIIKATAINHGGKTNGSTVPNPNAQASVIGQAIKEAGIDPRAVSYMEAHGTGTSLGDPIEITGLSKTFQQYTKDKQFCAIGSAKSNIGHCESAAGIAGVTKVLLQLKYGQLAPSLHSETLNPNIDFSNTPFVVQQELAEWKRQIVTIDGETKEYPRIAGISSFGAGGSNAHVVIEEYIPSNQERPPIIITRKNPAIMVLSAKNEEQLKEQVQRLLEVIEKQQFSDESLIDMAYTLQVGREDMEERLAMIVGSIKEFGEKLKSFAAGQDDIEDLYRGQVKRNKETLAVFTADEDLQKALEAWISKGKYGKLLDFWVKGMIVDWNKLYGDSKPHRISLPTYPFAKERYWVPAMETRIDDTITSKDNIHPLLHKNTSDIFGLKFSSTFTGQEFFLADHVVKGQRVLPGVAYLEMARTAVEQATGVLTEDKLGIRLENVAWVRPIAAKEESVRVHIGLYPDDNGEIAYEIYSGISAADAEPIIHSQGSAVLRPVSEVPALDLKALQAECSQSILTGSQCYEALKTLGLEYGSGHRGIDKVYVSPEQVLAKLHLPSAVIATQKHFVLHPSLMDAALQASIGFMMASGDMGSRASLKSMVPFALKEIEIIGNCTSDMWALLRYSAGSKAGDKVQKFDVDICDEQGNVCVQMKEFSSRVLESAADSVVPSAKFRGLMLQPHWKEQSTNPEAVANANAQHVVMLCELSGAYCESIETNMSGVRCLSLQSDQESVEERFQTYAIQVFEEIQNILTYTHKGAVLIQIVVPNQGEGQLFTGLSGLLKTAQLENPKIIGQMIEIEAEGLLKEEIIEILEKNSQSFVDKHVRYQGGKRWVNSWKEVVVSEEEVGIPWKDNGIYLITGGAGGLGLIFAKEIAQKVKEPILILTGRSSLDEGKQAKIKEMESLGALIEYKKVDVTDKQAVMALIQSIRDKFGNLHGIIHSAGVIRDNLILKKTEKEMEEVLTPKVAGLVNLDQASKEMSLDFFILFSSIAGSVGNVGQADYATGNAFMDAYARYRNVMVMSEERYGKTLSINWPLWKDGGMHVDKATEKILQSMGMIAMQTSTGIQVLYQSLVCGNDQVMVAEGDVKRLRNLMELE
ncbi:SDR family NAD(P)-dependent oxidoreductase [Pelosinus fermentans]|uniref:Mycocerosate synthase, 6-deoxyerythronolide-B synthase n=1 Tax=Pelosinus fermentans JBW45 TaxID=1192197 RepID=I9NKA3_9FIRM|nr:SDR family NAD(P)-dependent oxidoreductase [Pelosinus fermentans]AJQ25406.1 Mycocerosate synthase, 6-deoxyerythronolide-B synthase [Pelosinus fermentans JBW45]